MLTEAEVKALREKMIYIGQVLLDLRKINLAVTTKRDYNDLQTEGDRVAEDSLVTYLRYLRPDIGIVGEEGAAYNTASEWQWLLDPVDATTRYAYGLDNFSISAGLTYKSCPVAGYLYFPAQDKFIQTVEHPLSIKINDRTLEPADILRDQELKDSVIGFDFSAGADRVTEMMKYCLPLCQKTRYVYMEGSFTGGILQVLEGKWQAYFHPGATKFDLAASIAICRSIGLWVERPDDLGIDLSLDFNPVLIANSPKLADEIMRIVS